MNAPTNSNRKAELLANTVEHVAIDQYDARPIPESTAGFLDGSASRGNHPAITTALGARFLGPDARSQSSFDWDRARDPRYDPPARPRALMESVCD